MRILVWGLGAVGLRAARQVSSIAVVDQLLIASSDDGRTAAAVESLGPRASRADEPEQVAVDVAILALPAPMQAEAAAGFVDRGIHVVSTSDATAVVDELLELGPSARDAGVTVAVGAAFAPGLACVLAHHGARDLDTVDEIHVARAGTGGPSCARAHHASLSGRADEWRDGAWVSERAGSGRQVCWFPDPIGGRECARAGLPVARLLVRAFPGVQRVSARAATNRRDHLTARLPMLRRPHPDGGPGAIRVEVRGRRSGARAIEVMGAMDRPSAAAGAVAALTAEWAAAGRLAPGAAGLAELVESGPFLAELSRRGVKSAVFDGG